MELARPSYGVRSDYPLFTITDGTSWEHLKQGAMAKNIEANPSEVLSHFQQLDSATAQRVANLQKCQAANYAHIKGLVPLISSAIAEWQDILPTSIITTTERQDTMAFIGTTDGRLVKV